MLLMLFKHVSAVVVVQPPTRENYTGPPGRITAPWDYWPMRGNVLRGRRY